LQGCAAEPELARTTLRRTGTPAATVFAFDPGVPLDEIDDHGELVD
jgi:hypothetical protein